MIDYCYHTHTYRCGHAKGREEDYVLAAIGKGFKVIGFTDHVFLPNIEQPGMRGSYLELDDYINTINELKYKYRNQIEIHLGFECEYDEELEPYYHYLKEEKGIEYLILGQHLDYHHGDLIWIAQCGNSPEEIMATYSEKVIKGIKSGLFSYVAHPDLVLRFCYEINPFIEAHLRKMCEVAAEYNIPFELNLGGLRNRSEGDTHLQYPNKEFFKIVSEYNIKVIIGLDTHNPVDFYSSDNDFAFMEKWIEEIPLRHVNRLDFSKKL